MQQWVLLTTSLNSLLRRKQEGKRIEAGEKRGQESLLYTALSEILSFYLHSLVWPINIVIGIIICQHTIFFPNNASTHIRLTSPVSPASLDVYGHTFGSR